MRQTDSVDVGAQYQKVRLIQTAYGFLVTLCGVALIVWLPARESVRVVVGLVIIFLGGMMVNQGIVTAWFGAVRDAVPFLNARPQIPRDGQDT